jgi:hypothetical protein
LDVEDGEEDSEDESEEGAPLTKLDARRQKQAAGDTELQQSFRMASAELLKKYDMAPTGKTAEELGETDSSGSEEDGDEEGSGEESDEGEESGEEEGSHSSDDGSGDQAEPTKEAGAAEDEPSDSGEPVAVAVERKRQKVVELDGPLDVPFTLKVSIGRLISES